jgi:hypothetical protein
LPLKVVKSFIINYCFIHKIGKMYVNKKTREVTFEVNRKREAALTEYSGGKHRYILEQAVFDRLHDILKKRKEEEFAEMKNKDDKTSEFAIMKMQVDQINNILIKKYGKAEAEKST